MQREDQQPEHKLTRSSTPVPPGLTRGPAAALPSTRLAAGPPPHASHGEEPRGRCVAGAGGLDCVS